MPTPRSRPAAAVVLAVSLLTLGTCREPTALDVAGYYDFQSINGRLPPLALLAPTGCSRTFDRATTLTVRDSLNIDFGWSYLEDCRASAGRWIEVHPGYFGTYSRTRDSLSLSVRTVVSGPTAMVGATDGSYITLALPDSLRDGHNQRVVLRFGPRIPIPDVYPTR